MLYYFIIIVVGILASFILFSKFPILKKGKANNLPDKISIIIPARNEEKNIGLLLRDLMSQTTNIHEIICVDDGSVDQTYEVALSFGVKVVAIKDKPSDWTGKAWACQSGGAVATGDILLFLDADVRFSPDAISSLVYSYNQHKCVISVQPYHKTEKHYEQFSFFFNLIQIAGNGTSIRFTQESAGLYGPVILIDTDTYRAIDGHLAAKKSIVDDVALGEKLRQMGFPYKLFLGGKNISFRMYGNNFKSLFQGWTKNYATGASKAPIFIFILVFLWVASCASTVIYLVKAVISLKLTYIVIGLILYACWIFEFFRISNRLGRFKKTTIIMFPVYLIFFIGVFLVSLFKKVFRKDVTWKDRKIKLD